MKKYFFLAVVDFLFILYMMLGPAETDYVVVSLWVVLFFRHIYCFKRSKKEDNKGKRDEI